MNAALHAVPLDTPAGETTQAETGIVGVACQTAAVTGRSVFELQADGEEKGKDELDERLGMTKELSVGCLIVEIDGERAVVACRFGCLSHVSSPCGWRLGRMRHYWSNILTLQAYSESLKTSPLNSVECGIF